MLEALKIFPDYRLPPTDWTWVIMVNFLLGVCKVIKLVHIWLDGKQRLWGNQ